MGKQKTAERPGFMVYFDDILPHIDDYGDTEMGQIFKAMLLYSHYGEIPDFQDRGMRTLWKALKAKLDLDDTRYKEKCETNRRNALKRSENGERREATAANANDGSQKEQQKEQQKQLESQMKAQKERGDFEGETFREREQEFERKRQEALAMMNGVKG